MHELSISAALLEQVGAVMQRHRANGVTKITLRLGPLSGIAPTLLQAAYVQTRVDTVFACTDLVIVEVPVRVFCHSCAAEGNVPLNRLLCPACGSANTQLLSGDEMLLETVDLVF